VACIRALETSRSTLRLVTAEEDRSSTGDADPILAVRDLDAFHGRQQVLHGISLELGARECVALVGESGSGKTTLARTIMGLHPIRGGEVRFRNVPLRGHARERPVEVRRGLQYIFQSPYNSLNPRHTVGEIVRVPIEHFFGLRGRAASDAAAA